MADESFEPGTVHTTIPGVRRITAGNGGFMTGPGTNTYLVGADEVAVIDPGPDDEAHLAAVEEAAGGRARWVLVTHNHPDHSRGARRLAGRLGVPVYAHAAELTGIRERDFRPDRTLADGDTIRAADFTLRCLYTPGHAADHLCFLHEETGLLFAGDHLMESTTVVIAPPDGDMAAYLASLERLGREPLRAIAPGHGGLMRRPATVIESVLAHRRSRERQVLDALAEGPRSVDAMATALYPDVPEPLRPVAGWQVYAHLLKLQDEGRAEGNGPDGLWQLSPRSAARRGDTR